MVESSEELGMQQIMVLTVLTPWTTRGFSWSSWFSPEGNGWNGSNHIESPEFSPLSSISEKDPTIRERAPVAKLDVPAAAMVQMGKPMFGEENGCGVPHI